MSPRAAWRLESLGFTAVYDYAAGEADWFASDLPMEGDLAALPRVGKFTRRDVPRCGLSEAMGAVRDRVQAAGWDICVVVNEESVVLGLLRERELGADPDAAVAHMMRSGPATYRPAALVAEVAKRMETTGASGVLVTFSDGRLIGWLRRDDAAQAVMQNEDEAGENGRGQVRT
jgi:CBS domain-containing protein